MKVTRLGYPIPVLSSGLGLNSGGRVPPGGNDLQVLTSNGSNGRYWGENVRRITADGSNTLLSPDVNFASGSNISFSISSNTLRIHGQAGGSSVSAGSNSTRVREVSTAGASTTLWSPFDHAHDGIGTITSSSSNTMQRGTWNIRPGAGIALALTDTDGDGEFDTTTIVNTGQGGGSGGGSSSAELPFDIVPASPDADDDEFTGTSLDGAWTNPVTSAAGQTNTIVVANGWMVMEPATAGSSSTGKRVFGIRKVSPSGSFTVSAKITGNYTGSDLRPGIFVAKTGGGGYICGPAFQDTLAAVSIGFSGYSESADWGSYDGVHLVTIGPSLVRHMGWYRIRYDAGASTVYFDYSINGVVWRQFSSRGSVTQRDRMGIVLWSNGATVNADEQLAVGWFRVIDGSAAF